MNGRSGSTVVLDGLTATKTVRGPWEAEYMRRHPGVFVRVISTCTNGADDTCQYSMVEGQPATWDELDDALPRAAALLPQLWTQPAPHGNPHWRPALFAHLTGIVQREGLQLTYDDIRFLVREADHHQLTVDRCIHGDPTLANLVYDDRLPFERWRWIDPLTRPYIPGDPLVDLGKLYQSCLGYEQVLAGREPERHDALMECLAQQLGLCEYHGLVWCAIHLVRLIPYQHDEDKSVFAEMLHTLLDELKEEHTDD
jgi:hypothetical protein